MNFSDANNPRKRKMAELLPSNSSISITEVKRTKLSGAPANTIAVKKVIIVNFYRIKFDIGEAFKNVETNSIKWRGSVSVINIIWKN